MKKVYVVCDLNHDDPMSTIEVYDSMEVAATEVFSRNAKGEFGCSWNWKEFDVKEDRR